MVASGEMPPENKKLRGGREGSDQDWFHESFVLRDGKSHIGPTPLRRLTRYEFENTPEAVLAVPLKVVSRFHHRHADGIQDHRAGAFGYPRRIRLRQRRPSAWCAQPPLDAFADAANYALGQFRRNPAAIKAVLGRAEIPSDASRPKPRQSFQISAARLSATPPDADYERVFHGLYAKHVAASGQPRESAACVRDDSGVAGTSVSLRA